LHNLAIDTRLSPVLPNSSPILSAILTYIGTSAPHLVSFVIKYPDRQMAVPAALIQQLITGHAHTLKTISLIDCAIGITDLLTALCKECVQLERLEVSIPLRDLVRNFYTIMNPALNLLRRPSSRSRSASPPACGPLLTWSRTHTALAARSTRRTSDI
jgi:hypothetical protein